MTVKVEIINTSSGIKQLEQEWDVLLAQSNSNNVFLTFNWVATWWDIFRDDQKELKIIAVRNTEGLIAIAPLYIEDKTLKLMGSGYPLYPDYLNFIVREGYEQNAIDEILCAINSFNWDYIDLSDMDGSNEITINLLKYKRNISWKFYMKHCANCRYIKLPSSYDTYYKSLSANHRGRIANSTNKISKVYKQIEYGIWPDHDISNGVEELGFLHRKRWTRENIKHSFTDIKYVRFHKEFVKSTIKKGQAKIHYLKLDGKIVALIYLIYYQNKAYYYQSGFDPEYFKYRPGLLLFNQVIKEAIKNGLQEFDLLKGDHGYKNDWADQERKTVTLLAFKAGITGRILFLRKFLLPVVKQRIKKMVEKG